MASPASPPTVALANQVGGHAGVQTTEDGSLLIKPALLLEHQFYQSVATAPDLDVLQPYIPKFLGTLKLEGHKTPEGEVVAAPDDKDTSLLLCACSLVLENLSHPFLKPNILDVKLGTVLHDEDASDEKRARMEKTARETTSFATGIRLTGFQVYDNTTAQPVTTPKSYGKTIAAADLPDGVARFFPVAPAPATLSPDAPNRGLPARLLLPILAAIKDEIEDISDALSGVELRMVGGSLLVLYEADWARAEGGLRWLEEHAGDEEGEEDDEEEGEEEGEGSEKKPGPPFVVKLIDFAHTRLKPGSGPDEGVLKGIETFLQLLEGRIEQVKKAVAASSEG